MKLTDKAMDDYRIVILQRGWVMVGKFERRGDECWLYDSAVVRRWGTEHGLGEIAKDGPTENTVLDFNNGDVNFNWLVVIGTINVDVNKWKEVLDNGVK